MNQTDTEMLVDKKVKICYKIIIHHHWIFLDNKYSGPRTVNYLCVHRFATYHNLRVSKTFSSFPDWLDMAGLPFIGQLLLYIYNLISLHAHPTHTFAELEIRIFLCFF